jgi:hypothetical protein
MGKAVNDGRRGRHSDQGTSLQQDQVRGRNTDIRTQVKPGPIIGLVNSTLTLPRLKHVGFSVHQHEPTFAGLTVSPRAFKLSAYPAASILSPSSRMLQAARKSRL